MAGTPTPIPGLSTLGIKFGYAIGAASTTPGAFTMVERCNSIGAISQETEQIDASALEDYSTRYTAGRQDSGGSWNISFNLTNTVLTQLETMISAYENRTDGYVMYVTVFHPDRSKAYFAVVQPPIVLPSPEEGQNELEVLELTFTVNQILGYDTAVEPTIA